MLTVEPKLSPGFLPRSYFPSSLKLTCKYVLAKGISALVSSFMLLLPSFIPLHGFESFKLQRTHKIMDSTPVPPPVRINNCLYFHLYALCVFT